MSVNNTPEYIDFGSSDGCPQDSYNNDSCNNGWNQDTEWYLSWGDLDAIPLPQIYVPAQAQQWAMISLYGATHYQRPLTIAGPMDQYDEDSSTYSALDAWNALWSALNSNPATAQNMTYSVEIHTAV